MKITRGQLRRIIMSEARKSRERYEEMNWGVEDPDSPGGVFYGFDRQRRKSYEKSSQPAVKTIKPAPRQPIAPIDKSNLVKHETPNYPHSFPADKRVLFDELQKAWEAHNASVEGEQDVPYFFIADSDYVGAYFGPSRSINSISREDAIAYQAAGVDLLYAQASYSSDQGNWNVSYRAKPAKKGRY